MKTFKDVIKSGSKKKHLHYLEDDQPRHSIVSQGSRVSISDVTEESLKVWKAFPKEIRQDPSFVSFQRKNDILKETNQQPGEGFRDGDSLNDGDDDDVKPDIENGNTKSEINQDAFVNLIFVTRKIGCNSTDLLLIFWLVTYRCFVRLSNGQNVLSKEEHKKNKYFTWTKLFLLVLCWAGFTFFLMRNDEKELEHRKIAIAAGETRSYTLHHTPISPRIKLIFEGTFLTEFYDETATNFMYLYLSLDSHDGNSRNISQILHIPIVEELELDIAEETEREKTIDLNDSDYQSLLEHESIMKVNLMTQLTTSFAMNFIYDPSPLNEDLGLILAAVVLVGLYVLIVLELVHRTLAAIMASTTAIAILAALHERPTLETVISWIDVETLLLLFGMMVLVAILSQTGVFDYLAVYAFKITKGKVWPLIICLGLFTGILSSVLDNVTTILLMAPVTIRLCEVMELNPVPVLIFAVIFSNIGGTMTPVGDPPNVIIASNSDVVASGVNFANFTLHMIICVVLVMIQAYIMLRFMFRDPNSLRFSEPKAVRDLKHQILIWQRAAASLGAVSKNQDVLRKSLEKKVKKLNRKLDEQLLTTSVPKEVYKATLQELQEKYPIRNKSLLIKSGFTLVFVIGFFFLHSAPSIQKLSLGWTALLGAVLLLVLYDREDIESILGHVEWATLVFFAALFVLMEALSELGLIAWIGRQTENVILSVGKESQLAVAILIILWVSAIASAFVDNIPLTTMMVKIVISLDENENLDLPMQPLIWALALGACLGGNGTLIGASANVVCAGIAEQHGYKFTFNNFFKIGFPVMIGSIIVATGYLMICHVLFSWH